MSIEDQICQAVDIIVQQAISQATFDRTIQGQVLSCVDASIGKYKIKYQDSTFYAYTNNTETTYSKGTNVYILIPGNDMSKDKTIVGASAKLGSNYINIITGSDKYDYIGNNCCNSTEVFSLCSYNSKNELKNTIELYNKETDYIHPGLSIDIIGLNEYLKESNYMMCGATFKTALPLEQQAYGNYGIKFSLKFLDNNKQNIIRHYIIDADQITGNPYKIITDTEQLCFFEIDGTNFISLENIQIFIKDFPKEAEENINYNDDIFIKNLKLFGAIRLTDAELDSYFLSITTPQGKYFQSPNVIQDKLLQAQLKVKGKIVNTKSQNLSFYWFEEQGDVTTTSDGYCSYGGQGWNCLNSYKIVQAEYDQNGNVIGKPIKEWIPAKEEFIVKQNMIKAIEKRYKCVVLYDGNILSSVVKLKNFDAQYRIEIISNGGTQFYLDEGTPILTCNIFFSNKLENINNYRYVWSSLSNIGYFQTLNSLINEPNKIQIAVNQITHFTTFNCTIYKNNDYIGTGSIVITNSMTKDTFSLYDLIINNGTQTFKYNGNGISPANGSLENPIVIEELTYYIYDNINNKAIEGNDLLNVQAQWRIPANNTLIEPLGKTSEELAECYNEIDDVYVFNGYSLSYKIADRYSINSQRNNIELRVIYNDTGLISYTNFTMIKEGDPGTNGTDFVCKIVPNLDPTDSSFIYYPIVKNGKLNFMPKDNIREWFKIQLWENGQIIFNDNQSSADVKIQWDNLINNYGNNIKEDYAIDIKIENNKPNFYYLYNNKQIDKTKVANIIKVTVQYNKRTFYATIPIVTITTINSAYNIKIKDYTGFKYAVYQSDGTSPKYDNSYPFELQVLNDFNEDISKNLVYNWNVLGSYYDKNSPTEDKWIKSTDLNIWTIDIDEPYKCYVKPANKITGNILNNAISCSIKNKNGVEVGYVHIPIHLYLNRYSLSNINGWDGNSVTINNDEGYILSPQVGAGYKDSNNSFTGVVIGTAKEINSSGDETGLLAYSSGIRSFFLDAETGKTVIGKPNGGQIIIDPQKDQALIQSGNYKKNPIDGEGLEINFTKPEINFGSGNFSVDEDGKLKAKGAEIQGKFKTRDENDSGTKRVEVEFSSDKVLISHGADIQTEEGIYTNQLKITEDSFLIKGWNLEEETENSINYKNGKLTIKGSLLITGKDNLRISFNAKGIQMNYDDEINKFQLTQTRLYFGNQETGESLSYSNGRLNITGSFKLKAGDDDNVQVAFNENGIRMSYEEDKDKFLLTQKTLLFSHGDPDEDDYNALEYRNGKLKISGAITATEGYIGGWKIGKQYIRAINDSLILWSDGRIEGMIGEDPKTKEKKKGLISSSSATEKTVVSDGQISMYSKSGKDWVKEGYIYTYDGSLSYSNVKWKGALTLASRSDKEEKPILFSVSDIKPIDDEKTKKSNLIAMAIMPSTSNDIKDLTIKNLERNPYVLFPITTNKQIREDCTKVGAVGIKTRDIYIYPDKDGNDTLTTSSQSVVGAINELNKRNGGSVPYEIEYDDNKKMFIEKYKKIKKIKDKDENGNEIEKEKIVEDKFNYYLEVNDEGTSAAQVTALSWFTEEGTKKTINFKNWTF